MKRLKSIVLAVSAVFLTLIGATPALPAAADSAALSIAPRKDYVIEPGKAVSDKLTIRNLDTSQPLDITLRVIDFTYTDDGGTPKLFLAQDAPQTTWSLKPFMTVPQTATIPAGGSKSLDISVSIPANQGAGSYYSAIVYSTGAPNGGNVGLSASGVTLAFVTVPGQVNENLKLKKFGGYNQATSTAPAGFVSFTSDKPTYIGYTLQNNGNVTEAPAGSITIKYMFGKPQTISNINPAGSLALIGQTRTFTTCIKSKPSTTNNDPSNAQANGCADPSLWPGIYTVTLDAFYGQNGNQTQEIIGHGWFVYMPLWAIIVLIAVILFLAFFIWRTYNKLRGTLYGNKMKRSLRRRKS